MGFRGLGLRVEGFRGLGFRVNEGAKIRGAFFRGPYDKDYSMLGSILGFPLFRETTILYMYVYS